MGSRQVIEPVYDGGVTGEQAVTQFHVKSMREEFAQAGEPVICCCGAAPGDLLPQQSGASSCQTTKVCGVSSQRL